MRISSYNPPRLISKFNAQAMVVGLSVLLSACSSGSNDGEPEGNQSDPTAVHASLSENPAYVMSTEFRGEDYVLSYEVTESGTFSPRLVSRNNVVAEGWALIRNGTSTFQIANQVLGSDWSLDVINDGVFETVTLSDEKNVSGQEWTITQLDNGYCRLYNNFTGSEIALDIRSDGDMTVPILTAVGNFSGQHWTISPISGATMPPETEFENCDGLP